MLYSRFFIVIYYVYMSIPIFQLVVDFLITGVWKSSLKWIFSHSFGVSDLLVTSAHVLPALCNTQLPRN